MIDVARPVNADSSLAGDREVVRAATLVRWRERVLRAAQPVLKLVPPPGEWDRGALIVQYHRIGGSDSWNEDPFSVGRRDFERQVAYLAERRRVVTVSEIARRLRESVSTDGIAAITFDDGFDCTYAHAWPILRARGLSATLFVDTRRLDGPRPGLTRSELRQMADEGMEVGSHTASHSRLVGLSDEAIDAELTESAEVIADVTGVVPAGFAYPFGRFDARALDRVRLSSYEYACGCRQDRTNRTGDDLYQLARVEINQADALPGLQTKMDGVYARAYSTLYRLGIGGSGLP